VKIKRYLAKDARGAMERIKKDMGPEAIILETRRVRQKGFLGLFKRRLVEITASIDDNSKNQCQEYLPFNLNGHYNNKKMETEIQELKCMVQQMTTLPGEKEKEKEGGPLRHLQQKLIDNEIDNDIAQKLTEEIKRDFPDKNLTEVQLYSLINDKIGRRLKFSNNNNGRHVYCFVGPTGVGKTTTLAKLAANYSIFKEKKVGLITIDTYRIGAVEQLKNYAQLIDIPLEVVMSPAELKQSLDKMKDFDVVMVDTAGRNAKNSLHLNELKAFTEVLSEATTFLVLSLTTKSKDLIKITDKFKATNYNSLIFTKLDETDTYGSILNIACHTTLPVAFLSTGQKVPEDFEIASEERLTNLILGVGL